MCLRITSNKTSLTKDYLKFDNSLKIVDALKKFHDEPNNILNLVTALDTEYKSNIDGKAQVITQQVKLANTPNHKGVIFDSPESPIPVHLRRYKKRIFDDVIKDSIFHFLSKPKLKITFHPVVSKDEFSETFEPYQNLDFNVVDEMVDVREYEQLPQFVFSAIIHFATADVLKLSDENSTLSQIMDKTINGEIKHGFKNSKGRLSTRYNQMSPTKRLKVEQVYSQNSNINNSMPFMDLFTVVKFEYNDQVYKFKLGFQVIDTSAFGSLKNLMINSGLSTDDKESITRDGSSDLDISDMVNVYLKAPNVYRDYALGDLSVIDALVIQNTLYQGIAKSLDLLGVKDIPLTVGARVEELITSRIIKKFPQFAKLTILKGDRNLEKELVSALNGLYKGRKNGVIPNAKFFGTMVNLLLKKHCKVMGGRCKSSSPLAIAFCALGFDLDIAGCYGSIMNYLPYYVGRPRCFDFTDTTKSKKFKGGISLEHFVKKYVPDLERDGWQAFINVSDLKYPQDLFASWNNEQKVTDLDNVGYEPRYGNTRIYQHEITNGVLTSSLLDIVLKTFSEKQKSEFLKKVKVISLSGYFTKDEVKTDEELAYLIQSEPLTVEYNSYDDPNACYAWCKTPIRELILGDLLKRRADAQKEFGKGSPQDKAVKELINTVYGTLVSHFFNIGNCIVANNITSLARCYTYLMEKKLGILQTITDGGLALFNAILHSTDKRYNRVQHHEVVQRYSSNPNKPHFKTINLFDKKVVDIKNDGEETILLFEDGSSIYGLKEIKKRIDEQCLKLMDEEFSDLYFVKEQFPYIDENGEVKYRKGLFRFETKSVFTKGMIHGASNYSIYDECGNQNLKARSYESNKQYYSLTPYNVFKDKNPFALFASEAIETNGEKITIQPPYMKSAICKHKDYIQRKDYRDRHGAQIGDTVSKIGHFNLFSPSQFRYHNKEQERKIINQVNKDKEKLGWSFERFFINDDGLTINYKSMIETIQKMVSAGDTNIKKYLSINKTQYKKLNTLVKPFYDVLLTVRAMLNDGKKFPDIAKKLNFDFSEAGSRNIEEIEIDELNSLDHDEVIELDEVFA